MNEKRKEKTYGVVVIATLISCFVAFFNGYPLVYPDTGSYLHSGWEYVVFLDRTIFYGLFLHAASYGSYVMGMVFFQGLLVCYLLYKALQLFLSGLRLTIFYLASVGFVTLFTGFSYNVSILLPDIFSSISFLALLVLLLHQHLNWLERVVLAAIFVFSICTQLSTLPVLVPVLAAGAVYMLYNTLRKKKTKVGVLRLSIVAALALSSLLIIPYVHYKTDGNYKISGGSHVFVMNHLIEQSILDEYLKENCDKKNYKLCAYKDSIAFLGWDFMWAEKSPLYRTGGWDANREEYKAIIRDILKTPKYRKKAIIKGAEYSLKQFFTFQTTVSPPQLEGSAPYGQVQWRLPDTAKEYISSRQNTNRIELSFVNAAELPVFIVSLLAAVLLLCTPKLLRQMLPEERWSLTLLILYLITSAIMCANLSTVHARFQNRIVWMLPIFVGVILMRLYQEKRASQKGN